MIQIRIYACIIAMFSLIPPKACSQAAIGAGIAYGSEIENLGLVLNGQIFVTDQLAIAPDFIYFLNKTSDFVFLGVRSEVTSKLWEFNGNIHYFFLQGPVAVYGLTGLNYSRIGAKVKASVPSGPSAETSAADGEIGINLGLGANFDLKGPITPFAEVKFVVISTDQLVLSGGIRIRVG